MFGLSPSKAIELHPGYIAGNWYQPVPGAALGAGTALVAATIALVPFVLSQPIKISDLGARVTTASAGGNFQLAIYANNPATGRPTGTALVSTGNISTASAATVSAAVTVQATLAPGIYWMAVNADNSTVALQAISNPNPQAAALIGSTTLANVSATSTSASLSLTVAQTFGTWPNLTAASFTEQVASRNAVAFLKAA